MVRAPRASPQAWDPGSSSSRELELRDFAETHAHADMKIKAGRQLIDNVRILQGGIMHEYGGLPAPHMYTGVSVQVPARKEGRLYHSSRLGLIG